MLAEGNDLWHIFSWKLVPCLEGDAARQALSERPEETVYLFCYEYPPEGVPLSRALTRTEALALPEPETHCGADWYLVDRDFTWTYVHTHEAQCGPYFCRAEK